VTSKGIKKNQKKQKAKTGNESSEEYQPGSANEGGSKEYDPANSLNYMIPGSM